MRTNILLSALSLAVAVSSAAGCGETSYFEVDVVVKSNVATVDAFCLSKMNTCEVQAESSRFSLGGNICVTPTKFGLGKFQYTTEKESGSVAFHIDIYDGNLKKLGQGDASGPIKPGGIQTVTLEVTPDAAAFACTAP